MSGLVNFSLVWHLEDDGTEESFQEVRNDAKFLYQVLHSIDTAKGEVKGNRRVLTRLSAKLRRISRKWARDDFREVRNWPEMEIEEEQVKCWHKEEEVSISEETLQFLYKNLCKEVPEGVRLQLLPIQEVLVSIERQYDAWDRDKSKKDEKTENDSKPEDTPLPPSPEKR